jgi:gliding motility-associated-like protein
MKHHPPCYFTGTIRADSTDHRTTCRFSAILRSVVVAAVMSLSFISTDLHAQSFGVKSSAVWITDCNQSNFFNTSGLPADLPGPPANVFDNYNFGVHTQNSGTLMFRGAQVRTFKNPASSNVCSVKIFYRVYPVSGTPGAFTSINIPLLENCNGQSGTYPSGGSCTDGDQKWHTTSGNINLTNYAPGNYALEVYFEATGSHSSTSLCDESVILNNGGANYKAYFSIQSPILSSTNPSTCNGTEGSITIGGLVPGATYQLTYLDDGVTVGPAAYTANASGQIILSGLNHGFYSNFILQINGCTTNLFTGIILSNPVYVPYFNPIPPFCAGTTPPVLPTTSLNGITGTWNPAIVNNQTSGTYTFTPDAGTCGFPVVITITVIQRVTPTFSFGTSLTICAGGTVPALYSPSDNGISGTWNPAVVDNQNSGVYTFTPDSSECANETTFTVTVNPNITPTFSFGTSLTICAGSSVPTLPNTSNNGITGTWSPAVVDNQNSGVYTFTPDAGQCATTTTFTVTVIQNITPTFSFGTSLTICAGGSVPALYSPSDNGISGTWNPAVVDNQNSGVYTFTPDAGQCATTTTFTVTVIQNITPTFSFGTSLTICAGGTVPTLYSPSDNGITGTWSPAVVDNQNSGVYTFTPDAGQCATTATFTVTVNPNITPTFSFGTSLTICAGGSVPVLPNTSNNGITGTWNPAVVDNQNSGIYTFTPDAGQCATTATFTVTVNPNITPTFSFGSTLSICTGGTVPILPVVSDNGISGSWNPSVVSNQSSGTYVFTAGSGCVLPFTFTVTVNPIVTPVFSFGTFRSICIGGNVPVLENISTNGVRGTWNPAVVNNSESATYMFTPDADQCANGTSFTLEVNPVPALVGRTDTTVYDGDYVPQFNFTEPNGAAISWTNTNTAIGLGASGSGFVPAFTAVNMTNDPAIATIQATAVIGGCTGPAQSYKITVMPLNKDVFVPNVFSPNGDGKNDILYVYGNYITKVDMRIFNQWGQLIATITDKSQGWNGTHKGSPQPVGVYVYVLKAELSTGKTVNLKGPITLIR